MAHYLTNLFLIISLMIPCGQSFGVDINGQLKNAQLEKSAADPVSNIVESRLYYNTTSKKPKIYNGVAWSDLGGSSGGSGEKNYISANPSGATDTTGWNCVGDLDIARTTTLGDLPREITTASGLKITADANVQSVADYCYFDFTLDDIDVSKKLNIKWSQKQTGTYVASDLAVVVTTQADRTTALHTPQVTNISAADYDFNAYGFDTSTTLTLSLVIRATADMATNGGIVISDVVVGPGKIITGAAASAGVSFTPVFAASTLGTLAASSVYWARSVDKLVVQGTVTASASIGGGNLNLDLPLNTGKLATTHASGEIVGHWWRGTASSTSRKRGSILAIGNGTNAFVYFTSDDQFDSKSPFSGTAASDIIAANNVVSFEFTVRIAEWAGSGTVNLGANDYEVAYTTGSWDANSTATAYGWTGATISGDYATTTRSKTVTWQSPIQNGEEVVLWMKSVAGSWQPAAAIQGLNDVGLQSLSYTTGTAGADSFGFSIVNTSTTTTRVQFGRHAWSNMAGASRGWNVDFLNYQWAVVKGKIGSAVAFGLATATESGLVKGGQVPGITSGVAIGDGYVGQYKATSETSGKTLTVGQYVDMSATSGGGVAGGVALTAGLWHIIFSGAIEGPNSATFYIAGIGTTAGNSSDGLSTGINRAYMIHVTPVSGIIANFYVSQVVNISSTTNYYGKLFQSGGTANTARSIIYAIRL